MDTIVISTYFSCPSDVMVRALDVDSDVVGTSSNSFAFR